MKKSIQADIEAIRVLKILKKAEFRVNVSNSLQTAISALEAMRDAKLILSKVEMPEGKLKTKLHIETLEIKSAKLLKENKELKAKIKEKENG